MPEILCKISGISRCRRSLEIELDRKLNDSRIKRVRDLPERSAGYGLSLTREVVRVIEHIEELCTEFDVRAFRNPGPFNHTEIDIPETGPAYGG